MSSTDALVKPEARAARQALERLISIQADADGPTPAPDLPAGFNDAVERYVGLLLDANRRMNLTRILEPAAIARLHLLDALAALPIIDRAAPASAVDLGTGGGVPGLVLAMARPEIRWTLVDSVARKVAAVTGFAEALGLRNVAVVAQRAEVAGRDPDHRETHDLVTARALAALPVLLEYALPLLRTGGTLVAWKGPMTPGELRAGTIAASLLGGEAPSVRPAGHRALGDHRFVIVGKRGSTPPRYPRRPGEPSRRPLGVEPT